MRRLPPGSTRSYTLVPFTTRFRSDGGARQQAEWLGSGAGPARGQSAVSRRGGGDDTGAGIEQQFVDYDPKSGQTPLAALAQHAGRSEEHTSELQSLMRSSYAVFCFKKNTRKSNERTERNNQR